MWCWDVVVLFLRLFRRRLLAILGLGKAKADEPLLPMQVTAGASTSSSAGSASHLQRPAGGSSASMPTTSRIGTLGNEADSWAASWGEDDASTPALQHSQYNRHQQSHFTSEPTDNTPTTHTPDKAQQMLQRIEQRKIDNLFAEMEPEHTTAPTVDLTETLGDASGDADQPSQRLAMDDAFGKGDLVDWDEGGDSDGWEDPSDDIDLKDVQATLRAQKQRERQRRRQEREERLRKKKQDSGKHKSLATRTHTT
ncbi:hypothetical protein PTSG_02158 [Salpingoeca rosetta]|uniref:Uncharacterized protein n=1 Tax=Salpingoeca rosetta (strain ATCC 50818 / BSB-021) TaxID=946362 RepID=F2U1D5_SALR5|nr:uncharacterized protein PTSG_02158 [Salpingoeca rosetta]EGD81437.1 hypothetical protein PTSG_02158 [Salpingoeca rosetta]|eukprot:XP_004996641.1 hypothetical protein PTSG_02158 [Salpingoeca rosetta]